MLMLTHFRKGGEDSHPAKSGSGSKGPEAVINPNPAGEFILAKTAEQGIQFKTTGVQSGILPTDPAGSKVVQIDGEGKDSGFLASHESLPEHLSRLEQAGRSSEGAQRNLASQTLNQIVQKAVLLNNNGQSTVQIDLKPDFLGHIRMQIVTESQQVVVRIVAEFPFVKDMLDSNLNQLRTELQAQGLDVDELEVSVADDSQANEDLYQKTAEARRAQAAKNNQLAADAAAEDQSYLPAARSSGMADSVIDFFV